MLNISFQYSEGYRATRENNLYIFQHKINNKWETIARETENHKVVINCTEDDLSEVQNFIMFIHFWETERETKRKQ